MEENVNIFVRNCCKAVSQRTKNGEKESEIQFTCPVLHKEADECLQTELRLDII